MSVTWRVITTYLAQNFLNNQILRNGLENCYYMTLVMILKNVVVKCVGPKSNGVDGSDDIADYADRDVGSFETVDADVGHT